MKKLLLAAIASMFLSACGSVPVLDASSAAELKGKTLVRSIPPTGTFQILTPGKLAVGDRLRKAIGVGVSSEPIVPDPSLAIAAQLTAQLDLRYGTKTVSTVLPQAPSNMAQLTALAQPHAEYVLEVRTPSPSMVFYFTDTSRYRATFTTYASLIDLKSQKSVAWAACNYFPESIVGAASYEEMLSDDAKRLKQDLAAGTSYCEQELTKKLLPN